jgi:hypothetical protein
MNALAENLYARGLVKEPTVQIWPSDEMAAEYLGYPTAYVRVMGTSSLSDPAMPHCHIIDKFPRGELIPVNSYQLGWQPSWNEEKFFEHIDDEIKAVLELDTVKATLFDSFKK